MKQKTHTIFHLELTLIKYLLELWLKITSQIYCPKCKTDDNSNYGNRERIWKKFDYVYYVQRYQCSICPNTYYNVYSNTKYANKHTPPMILAFRFLRSQIMVYYPLTMVIKLFFDLKSKFLKIWKINLSSQLDHTKETQDVNQQILSADFIDSMKFFYTYCLNEVQKRLFAGLMSILLERGGQGRIHSLLDIWPKTIKKGKQELIDKLSKVHIDQKQRKNGGGRKNITNNVDIQDLVEKIVEDDISGNPEGGLMHIRKTPNKVREALQRHNFHVSVNTVRNIYKKLGYSLKVNAKKLSTKANHVLRDPQFKHIKTMKKKFTQQGLPVVSIDGKKKEGIDNNAQHGQKYCKKAVEVNDHSFVTDMLVPFGVYDIVRKMALVFCGTNASTAEFAVEALSYWWENIGCKLYENATEILVLCDGGGSNSHRSKLWKYQVQKNFVDRYGITVTICHYPPGTSKWNPIEHCCFSGISKNWEGEPLTSYEKALNFIRNGVTKKCETIFVTLSKKEYKTGLKIEDYQFESMNIEYHDPKPEWSYTIKPRDKAIIKEIEDIDNGLNPKPKNSIQQLHCGKTAEYWLEHSLKYYSHGNLGHDIAFLLKNHDPIDFLYDNEFWNPKILYEVCLKNWRTKMATYQNIRNYNQKICWKKPLYSDFSSEYFIKLYLDKYPENSLKYRIADLISNYEPSEFNLQNINWDINQLSKVYNLKYNLNDKKIYAKIRNLLIKIDYDWKN